MKLHALTVSVNYSDLLVHTIATNKDLFDRWVIVTDLRDTVTHELCAVNNLLCVKTDVFYTKGIFNKWAAINEGLKYVDDDAWVLFIDSDIALDPSTRRVLENLSLNKGCLYGIDRLNCVGLQAWLNFRKGVGILKENWMLTTAGLEFGARLVHHYGHEGENGRFEGYRPCGYFQLAHRSAFTTHPQDSLGADHEDMVFARQWPRDRRVLIPEIYCVHLEAPRVKAGEFWGVNWYGRVSPPFHEGFSDTGYPQPLPVARLPLRLWILRLFFKVLRWFKRKHKY